MQFVSSYAIQLILSTGADDWTAAIYPILSNFENFDGVRQLITSNLLVLLPD